MAVTLKAELTDLLKNLDGPTKPMQDVVTVLEQKEVVIPENEQSKREICRFIQLFFCQYPVLMQASNKRHLKDFTKSIGLTAVSEVAPNRPETKGKM